MFTHRIPDRAGAAFEVAAGETFEVINPEGEQVADLVAFGRDSEETFSQGQTRTRNGTLRISTGDPLITDAGNPILTITRDDCGVHDLLYPPCNQWLLEPPTFEDEPGGCEENLALSVEPWDIDPADLPETLNLFQHSTVADQRYLDVHRSPADPGDVVEFRADQDAIVAVSSCSAFPLPSVSQINGDELTPIDLRLPDGTDVHDATVQDRNGG